MPQQYKVTQAFHYAAGGVTTRYTKGVQPLPPVVAEHALGHGFAEFAEHPNKPRRTQAAAATVEEPKHGTD